jgi:glycosyltransferase involved in cell wall biosynthesis
MRASSLLKTSHRPLEDEAGYSHIALSYVVPFYFDQPDISPLAELLLSYSKYPAFVLDRVQFVCIDDGSPVRVALPDEIDLNLLLLRIEEDRPWNQPGARNLGVVYARSDKVLLTDLDHEVPPETLAHALAMRSPGRRIYKLARLASDRRRRKPHANTFILSRARFLQLYGYDEDFCGAYGADDLWFLRWQRYHGSKIRYLPSRYFVRLRWPSPGAAPHALVRDRSTNAELYRRKRQACETFGPEHGHSRRFLEFSWRVLVDQRRRKAAAPAASRWWPLRWRWNKLSSSWPR